MWSVVGKLQDLGNKALFGKEVATTKKSFYECVDKFMSGKEVPMSTYAGSVLCVVNVASN